MIARFCTIKAEENRSIPLSGVRHWCGSCWLCSWCVLLLLFQPLHSLSARNYGLD